MFFKDKFVSSIGTISRNANLETIEKQINKINTPKITHFNPDCLECQEAHFEGLTLDEINELDTTKLASCFDCFQLHEEYRCFDFEPVVLASGMKLNLRVESHKGNIYIKEMGLDNDAYVECCDICEANYLDEHDIIDYENSIYSGKEIKRYSTSGLGLYDIAEDICRIKNHYYFS